jgi:photosystem II stability/assembly factor-like uncharacterized protein
MSDLDRIVGQLREDVAHRRWPEPDEIRSRGARRTTGQILAGVAAAVAVLVAGSAGAFAVTHRTDHGIPPAATVAPSSSSSPSPSSPAPQSVRPSTVEPTAPGSGVLPAGSTVDDLTFVSPTVGWLLAATPCPAGTCLAIVHTTDGGHTWTRLPAPPSDVPADVPGLGAQLRFANARIGYLYSSSPPAFYSTSDGGSTWVAQQGPTHAIEVANGTALRVTSTAPDCQPGCSFRIVRAPIGSDQWTTVNTPAASGAVQLLRTGHRAFAALYGNQAGGVSAHAHLFTSADDGATWTSRPDPCGTRQGAEADGTRMAVADDGSMTMLCTVRFGTGATFVVTSTDGGATFGPQRPTPGMGLTVGAASAGTLFVSSLDGATLHLYRSDDGGTNWTVAATAPGQITQGAVPSGVAGFQNAHDGWWLPGQGTVFATTDAGRTWTPHGLSG